MKKIFSLVAAALLLVPACKNNDGDKVAVTRVNLNQPEISMIVGGDDVTLVASVLPENATDKTVTWASNHPEIASVNNGVVTAKSAGDAVITVTTNDGAKTANCKVNVIEPSGEPVTGVTLDKTELTLFLNEFEEYTLTPTIEPDDAGIKTVSWSSSNPLIAFVNSSGTVTAMDPGKATITVTTLDGKKTATCEVTVKRVNGFVVAYKPSNVTYVEDGNYYEMTAYAEGDHTFASLAPNTASEINYLYFEYQLETAMFVESIRFREFPSFNDSFGGYFVFTLFEVTGIDPDNETLWKIFTYDLKDKVSAGILNGETFENGAYGNWVLDFSMGIEAGTKFLFRNVKVISEAAE